MRVIGAGHLLFALGLAGLGVLSLVSGDFALNWQPVPAWVPWRETLAYASGILLLAGGIGMLVKRTAAPCALAMATYMLSWVLVLQVPRAAAAPGNVGVWLGVSESTVLMTGGWMVFASLARPADQLRMRFVTGSGGARVARLLFGAACLVLGLSHFVYADGTASMVPAWLPDRMGFAYLTGAGHFAAGLGILCGVLPRLAATMEAIMISLFVLLVHIPGVASAPTSRLQWTMLFVASALAGAVWAIARSLRDASWGWARRSAQVTST
ncbi:MAG: DoxX family membrane protein [Bryobacteraceae bacterium]